MGGSSSTAGEESREGGARAHPMGEPSINLVAEYYFKWKYKMKVNS